MMPRRSAMRSLNSVETSAATKIVVVALSRTPAPIRLVMGKERVVPSVEASVTSVASVASVTSVATSFVFLSAGEKSSKDSPSAMPRFANSS